MASWIHLLVVALLQVDHLALGGAGDQDHREAVGGGVRQRGQAVEEARRRDGDADAGLLRQVSGDRSGIAGVLLVAERQHAQAFGLRHAQEVGDRDAGHGIQSVDAVQLKRINDEVEAVGQLLLACGAFGVDALCCCGHLAPSRKILVSTVRVLRLARLRSARRFRLGAPRPPHGRPRPCWQPASAHWACCQPTSATSSNSVRM
jgi:hypothetical protein